MQNSQVVFLSIGLVSLLEIYMQLWNSNNGVIQNADISC
jgi:hypothetical protein